MTYKRTTLCQALPGGCMGCCGHDFTAKREVIDDVKKNTTELQKIGSYTDFRDRADKDDLCNSGVCKNVILRKGRVQCGIHPVITNGEDLRKHHCDVRYLCKTARQFARWNEKKQRSFLTFVAKQQLDWFTQSRQIDDDTMLSLYELHCVFD